MIVWPEKHLQAAEWVRWKQPDSRKTHPPIRLFFRVLQNQSAKAGAQKEDSSTSYDQITGHQIIQKCQGIRSTTICIDFKLFAQIGT